MWNHRLSRINHALDSILNAMISAGFGVVLLAMLAEASGLIA